MSGEEGSNSGTSAASTEAQDEDYPRETITTPAEIATSNEISEMMSLDISEARMLQGALENSDTLVDQAMLHVQKVQDAVRESTDLIDMAKCLLSENCSLEISEEDEAIVANSLVENIGEVLDAHRRTDTYLCRLT
jgi:hypothetical protein